MIIRDGLVGALQRIFEAGRIRLLRRLGQDPILVYSTGKAGSSAVYRSLREARLANPIYHLHLLSPRWLADFDAYYASLPTPIAPAHMRTSRLIRRELDRAATTAGWNIVTLVRDPIQVRISAIFENLLVFHPELVDPQTGAIRAAPVQQHIATTFAGYVESTHLLDEYFKTWFERELRGVFGADVFATPFDHERGYVLLEAGGARVLVIRCEDLDRCFGRAIRELRGGGPDLALRPSNVGQDKWYGEAYRTARAQLVLPRETCERIYALPIARHFYSPETIAERIERWSTPRA